MKFLFIFILLTISNAHSQELSFGDNKKTNLSDLKAKYVEREVEVYNFSLRAIEKYIGFSMNPILDKQFTRKAWKNSEFVKVLTTTGYSPMIEVYKFLNRKAYLTYKRADNKPFTMMSGYKDVISNMGPFYLVWEEDYKKDAAKRRDHWPFKITGFRLVDKVPQRLVPNKKTLENEYWGYQNFVKQCIACHSIDGFGSSKNGELISSGVVDKLSDKFFKAFISDPKSVRPKSRMDPFPLKIDIREQRISNIVSYLRFLSKQKKKKFRKSKSKKLDKILDQLRE